MTIVDLPMRTSSPTGYGESQIPVESFLRSCWPVDIDHHGYAVTTITSVSAPLSVWPSWSLGTTGDQLTWQSEHPYLFISFLPGTRSSWFTEDDLPIRRIASGQRALAELRSKTEFTWDQLARALGVNRRSLHFWARGERASASNFERLIQLVEIVRSVDQGDPAETTVLLLESRGVPSSPFALLCAEHAAVEPPVTESLPEAGRDALRPPPLPQEERSRRYGLAPWERIESLPDVSSDQDAMPEPFNLRP